MNKRIKAQHRAFDILCNPTYSEAERERRATRKRYFCHLCHRKNAPLYRGWPLCVTCQRAVREPAIDQSPVVLTGEDIAAALTVERPVLSPKRMIEALERSVGK